MLGKKISLKHVIFIIICIVVFLSFAIGYDIDDVFGLNKYTGRLFFRHGDADRILCIFPDDDFQFSYNLFFKSEQQFLHGHQGALLFTSYYHDVDSRLFLLFVFTLTLFFFVLKLIYWIQKMDGKKSRTVFCYA